MSTVHGLKVIKNNVNKNTEYKSEFWVNDGIILLMLYFWSMEIV